MPDSADMPAMAQARVLRSQEILAHWIEVANDPSLDQLVATIVRERNVLAWIATSHPLQTDARLTDCAWEKLFDIIKDRMH